MARPGRPRKPAPPPAPNRTIEVRDLRPYLNRTGLIATHRNAPVAMTDKELLDLYGIGEHLVATLIEGEHRRQLVRREGHK